ncbi:pseudouridine synthase [Flaviaesturariibacter flavus]|uniref:pseudouridine synthase n=1 Tax=Flaviaesturariibacter flavus TaxID=2502780 RepID=UPI001FB39A86|nr:pseudouridine synthase [Flaviaesturariibacter flavus]
MAFRYFILYKPFDVLSQFTPDAPGDRTLADLGFSFPPDVYPVGRLDRDSEGLLLLTNDNALKTRYLEPKFKLPKTYWAQVEGLPTAEAIARLAAGVTIRINGKEHRTAPARVRLLEAEPRLPERNPPIRYRKSIPTAWIELTITEGKNRQVRRMTAAAGLPTLRLVRVAIGSVRLGDLAPGEVRAIDRPGGLII